MLHSSADNSGNWLLLVSENFSDIPYRPRSANRSAEITTDKSHRNIKTQDLATAAMSWWLRIGCR